MMKKLAEKIQFKEFIYHVTVGDRLLFTLDDEALAAELLNTHFPNVGALIVPVAVFEAR